MRSGRQVASWMGPKMLCFIPFILPVSFSLVLPIAYSPKLIVVDSTEHLNADIPAPIFTNWALEPVI